MDVSTRSNAAGVSGPRDLETFVAENLDNMKITPFHVRVIALISAGLFFDLFDIVVFGSLVPDMLGEKFLQPADVAFVAMMTFVGLFVGSVGQGEFTDRFGRKTVYQANLLIFGVATIASATSSNYMTLAIWRFIAGVGLGAEIPLAYAFAAEFSPKISRGRVLSIVNFFGATMTIPISILFAMYTRGTIGWRGTFLCIGIAALVVFVLRIALPESPRWLASKGREKEALDVLEKMGVEVDKNAIFAPKVVKSEMHDPLLIIFKRYPRRILTFMAAMFFGNIGIYVILTWLPTLMSKQGMDIAKSLLFSFVITSAFPISSLALMYLLDKFGRIRTIIIGFLLAGLFTFLFRMVATPDAPAVVVLSVGFVMAFFIDIAGNTLIMMSGELFPTNARSSGGGLGLGAGRLGGIAASYIVVLALSNFGVAGVYAALGVSLFLGMISTAFFEFETAGLSLEKIAGDDRI